MRGSVNYQINQIFYQSEIFQPGTSRFADKQSALDKLSKGERTSSNISRLTNLHSHKYGQGDVKNAWQRLGNFAKENYGLKDMTKLEAKHVQAYLENKIPAHSSYNSWRVEASQLAKLENALHKFNNDKNQDLRGAIEKVRDVAKNELPGEGRRISGFDNPKAVIEGLKNDDHKLAAKLQLEAGCRRSEAVYVRPDQLKGVKNDPATGQPRGVVALENTKGGKERDVQLSEKTYRELENRTASGAFKVSANAYSKDVSNSARSLNEQYTGTHSFRHNYAVERYNECLQSGYNDAQAMQDTSWQLGHERAEVTTYYLR